MKLVTVMLLLCLQGYLMTETVSPDQDYDLTLLHVNDIHVRMEETSKYSSTCKQADKDAGRHWLSAIAYNLYTM